MALSVDPLTGLANHSHIHRVLCENVAAATRNGSPLALVVIDLDSFKQVNDQFGHVVGDAALRSLADRMRQVAGPTDVAGRIGGEEFAVLLPESTFDEATQFSVRLDQSLAREPISRLNTTASYGIVELEAGEDAIAFFERASRALYDGRRGSPPDSLGVREPRRPKPSAGGAAVRKPLDET